MSENLTTIDYIYPEKFRKTTPIGGIVTAKVIEVWYNISSRTAINWYKKAKKALNREVLFVKDWALYKGYNSEEHFVKEISKFLK